MDLNKALANRLIEEKDREENRKWRYPSLQLFRLICLSRLIFFLDNYHKSTKNKSMDIGNGLFQGSVTAENEISVQ